MKGLKKFCKTPQQVKKFRETTKEFILLQNFALMLLYWLLHLYNLFLVVASGIKYFSAFTGCLIALFSLHTAVFALIVW